ncbi:MAG: phosphate/phosphite/phosphonate ABC transporter substrate-binding protein [Acidobacteria bacterium]|nr:phosphate/phosphite/phosphonate ABC transporter substrate-binding protein [Acidobacteriota bacterium]
MNEGRRRALLVLLGVLAAVGVRGAEPPKELLFGLIPEMNIFTQKARFAALGEHLSKSLGVPIRFTILSRYGNIIQSFKTERMDGAFFGSFTGALAIERLGVEPLARPVNLDGTSAYRGYLFARKDSGIRTLADMRKKRMAFVDRATTAGFLFPLAYLRKGGVTSREGYFSGSFFTGSHDAAIAAVLEHKADLGAAKHSVYDRVRRADPRVDRDLVILAESPWVPSNGLCVRKDLPPELRRRIKAALLELHERPGGPEVLSRFGALRFIETTAADYAPVAEMAKQAGIDMSTYDYQNR